MSATTVKKSRESTSKMTLLQAEKYLRKIDEWHSVSHLNRELVLKWAEFLKNREEENCKKR